jgi:hypothetical protein
VTAASNPIIKNDAKPASIAARAQEFAIALLPKFASAPKDQKTAKTQPNENNGDAIDAARVPSHRQNCLNSQLQQLPHYPQHLICPKPTGC